MPSQKPSCASGARTNWPTTMHELESAERFVVWAFRSWRAALAESRGGEAGRVAAEFERQLGRSNARQALGEFAAAVEALCHHVKRTVSFHQTTCPCLGSHEACLICLVASCQQRNPGLARATAGWLVGPDGVEPLLRAVVPFSHRLLDVEMVLPERVRGPQRGGERASQPEPLTLH